MKLIYPVNIYAPCYDMPRHAFCPPPIRSPLCHYSPTHPPPSLPQLKWNFADISDTVNNNPTKPQFTQPGTGLSRWGYPLHNAGQLTDDFFGGGRGLVIETLYVSFAPPPHTSYPCVSLSLPCTYLLTYLPTTAIEATKWSSIRQGRS